jgi:site-specific recombinase XerC
MLGGLRRREVAQLEIDHLQQREEHWVIADMVGKAAHIRTVPVPHWVKSALDQWITSARLLMGDCSDASAELVRSGETELPKRSSGT